MNTKYLGDALDHWKGSLLHLLKQESLLTDLAVDPMVTDLQPWHDKDWNLYAKLLRISPKQIIPHKQPLTRPRSRYFDEIPRNRDLFLDPDTGISTKNSSPASQYLKAGELLNLIELQPSRIVAVYQHFRAVKPRVRREQIISRLASKKIPFSCCTYESATVAMLFFSGDEARIEKVHGGLNRHLDHKGPERTHLWKFPENGSLNP